MSSSSTTTTDVAPSLSAGGATAQATHAVEAEPALAQQTALSSMPRIPLVALGASAGGLQALEEFFRACPTGAGVAYVVVQHLAPDHVTLMPELLGRCTDMTVTLIRDGEELRPDAVHLIPPGCLLHLDGDVLRLSARNPDVLSLPIDAFFASAAREREGGRLVGVILSGTGSDGTRGAARIRAAGGLVLAQDPDSARFDGMPRSAIASGGVLGVADAESLPVKAIDFLQRGEAVPPSALDPEPGGPLDRILDLLREDGEIDFADYKVATVCRRVERRMQACMVTDVSDYLAVLREDGEERRRLAQDMLIGVTRFFRDPGAFEALARTALAPLVEAAADSDALRVWVAGVSTGEEAYTITMLLLEEIARQQRWCQLKVFATDVDESALTLARQGTYADTVAAEIDAERLGRFFDQHEGAYTAKRLLRQHIMFARHNLLADAPFTQMDLVVCRNTLIYFTPTAQERALARMEFALRPGGMLFLGPSESLAASGHGFITVDSRHKIFRRVANGSPASARMSLGVRRPPERPGVGERRAAPSPRRRAATSDADPLAVTALLEHYAPPSLLVSARGEVTHIFGDPGHLLTVRPGPISHSLTTILPETLAASAAALVASAARAGQTAASSVPAEADGTPLRLVARPLSPGVEDGPVLLSVETLTEGAARPAATLPDLDVVAVLEQELEVSRANLQTSIEDLEASNEELQAANEELISANEELQSSNEELQSLNEELNSVNAEYQAKGELLERTDADLEAMARAAGIAMVFVDEDLRVSRFSPAAADVFRLRAGDVGRPLEDLTHVLDYPTLIADLADVVCSLTVAEREVRGIDGVRTFAVRILPCAGSTPGSPGAVATFVDVTAAYLDARRLQAVLDALPENVAVLEEDGTIALVNRAWEAFAAANGAPDHVTCRPGFNYLAACRCDGEGEEAERMRAAEAARGVQAVLDGSLAQFTLRYPCHGPGTLRWFVMNVAPIRAGRLRAVVSHVDITAWFLEQAPVELSTGAGGGW